MNDMYELDEREDQAAYHADMTQRERDVRDLIDRLEREGTVSADQASLLRWASGV